MKIPWNTYFQIIRYHSYFSYLIFPLGKYFTLMIIVFNSRFAPTTAQAKTFVNKSTSNVDNYESDLYNKWITNKQITYTLQPLLLSIFLYSWMLLVSLVLTMWTRIYCSVLNTESLFHQLRHENEKVKEPEHHQSVTLHLICSS